VLELSVATVQSTVTVQGDLNSIVATESSAGSLTAIPLLDLPQSVQVVTREVLDEQKTYQYADSLTYLTDVQRAYTTIAGGVGNEVARLQSRLQQQLSFGTASSITDSPIPTPTISNRLRF
jgi:outer membrane receptor for monomeric catechols